MKVAVVILNWNGKKLLENFLPSVIKYNADFAEIVVVDNASTDDSIDFLNKKFPDIRLIQNATNYGFAKGYNKALTQIDAEYFVLLNSDIEVTEGWISPIIDYMDKHPHVAACQPKILDYKNKTLFEYAGAAGGFIDSLGYPFCRGRIFNTLEKDHNQYNNSVEIFWASGACMFIRAQCFFEMRGFDADFFAHMEEIDLCWRLKNAGYQNYFIPQSVVYHVGGATLNKMSPQKTYLNFRNNLSLIYKNITKNKLKIVLLKRFFLDFLAAISFVFSGGVKHFFAVFRAYWVFYSSMQKNRIKRKEILQKEVTSIYNKSIVFAYYFSRIKKFSRLKKEHFL